MKPGLMVLLLLEIIGYFGLIWILGRWKKSGELTANRFALLQTGYMSLFILTGILAVSTTFEVTIIGIFLSILCWILGYPLSKWIYKQFFINK